MFGIERTDAKAAAVVITVGGVLTPVYTKKRQHHLRVFYASTAQFTSDRDDDTI